MYSLLDPTGIISVRNIEAQKGQFRPYPVKISPIIVEGLKKSGISQIYNHQAEAISSILDGINTIITTSTSSGKSLTYTIPVLNSFITNPSVKAFYITPAKALGQNQKKTITDICNKIAWPREMPYVEVCDGDTSFELRRHILSNANIVITTPDMLHYSLLPRHNYTRDLFSNLMYVIIDESHTLRGNLGNHATHVIRRLRRICSHYGSHPVFILCSATIANPGEFAKNLTGLDFNVVSRDTSPSGKKQFVFYEPPSIERNGQTFKRLPHNEAARALGHYIDNGNRCIVFGRSRKQVENAYKKFCEEYPHLKQKVTPYKGTYTPELRRKLEADLFNGQLKGVFSTNALELGIDIGDLDVCFLSGYPGSISSTWQMAGRVGRKQQNSLIVFIVAEDPLDLYLARNNQYFFSEPCEKAVVSPGKLQFMLEHLIMAAAELPLTKQDTIYWNEKTYYSAVKFLHESGNLVLVQGKEKTYRSAGNIKKTGIRGEDDKFRAVSEDGEKLEEYNLESMLTEAFPGAIMSSFGSDFLVSKVDYENKVIMLNPLPGHLKGCVTVPHLEKTIIDVNEDRQYTSKVQAYAGTFSVITELKGYDLVSRNVTTKCSMAQKVQPYILPTTGMWIDFNENRIGVLHALEHLLHIVIPFTVMCERADIGTHVEEGRVYVYDIYPGGIGLAESALDSADNILNKCFELVNSCTCDEGCPKCLVIPQCIARNENLDKRGVHVFLAALLGKEISLPQQGYKDSLKVTPKYSSNIELRQASRSINYKGEQ